jgi:hypothetical protein
MAHYSLKAGKGQSPRKTVTTNMRNIGRLKGAGPVFFDPASARKPLFSARLGRCAETLKLHHEGQRGDRDRDR